MPLHSTADFRPFWPTIARLRYSLGGDRPNQTTHHAGSRIGITDLAVEPSKEHKGGISFCLHLQLAPMLQAPTYIYTCRFSNASCKVAVKVHGVFPSDRGNPASSREFNFTEPMLETVGKSLRHSCRSELTRQRNFATLGPL